MTFNKIIQFLKKKQKNLKIIIMGLDNAGKTAILNSFFKINTDSAPTFGYKTHCIKYNEFCINLVEIGGQYCFKEHWSNYFEKTDGIIFVVDSTDNRNYCEYLNDIIDLNIPICIMYNKSDILRNKSNIKDGEFYTNIYEPESIRIGVDWLIDKISINIIEL